MSATKQSLRQTRYDQKNTKRIDFKFSKNTDKDILEKLDSCANMQAYIKRLIRNDIAKEELPDGRCNV